MAHEFLDHFHILAIRKIATDNLGKTTVSDPVVISVNGTAQIVITKPTQYATFGRPVDIPLVATASDPAATISKVDFFSDGALIGQGTLSGINEYSVTWNSASAGSHIFTAIATDNNGVATVSSPVKIAVFDPPAIKLNNPING